MNLSNLTATSYTVLGMVASFGPATSYHVKKMIDQSVGYFWTFPRAQLYVELERLESLGLLESDQEDGGRRRRQFSITDGGREILAAWIRADDGERPQYRDPGLLKLYFAGNVAEPDVVQLAQRQMEVHERLLAEYRAIAEQLHDKPAYSYAFATVRAGIMTSESALIYWKDVANNPPNRSAFNNGTTSHSLTAND